MGQDPQFSLQQLTELIANRSSPLTREQRQVIGWMTHAVGCLVPQGGTPLYTSEQYIQFYNTICRFIGSGWTVQEIQRYIVTSSLGPCIYVFNIHSFCGSATILAGRLWMPVDMFHKLRKNFVTTMRQISAETVQPETRVYSELVRSSILSSFLHSAYQHPSLRY